MDNRLEFEYHSDDLKGIAIQLFKRLSGVSKIALTETETEEYFESSAPKLPDFDAFDVLQSAIFVFEDQRYVALHCESGTFSVYTPKRTGHTDQTLNAFSELTALMNEIPTVSIKAL